LRRSVESLRQPRGKGGTPTCTLGAFTAITEDDAEALVENARTRRREEQRGEVEAEDTAQPAAPEAR
jgi:hypothetical protein